jgi:hypothetical protein
MSTVEQAAIEPTSTAAATAITSCRRLPLLPAIGSMLLDLPSCSTASCCRRSSPPHHILQSVPGSTCCPHYIVMFFCCCQATAAALSPLPTLAALFQTEVQQLLTRAIAIKRARHAWKHLTAAQGHPAVAVHHKHSATHTLSLAALAAPTHHILVLLPSNCCNTDLNTRLQIMLTNHSPGP